MESAHPFSILSPTKTGNAGAAEAFRTCPCFPGSQLREENTNSTSQQREIRVRTLGLPGEGFQLQNRVSKEPRLEEAGTQGAKGITKAHPVVPMGLDPNPLERRETQLSVPIQMASQRPLFSSLQRRCVNFSLMKPYLRQLPCSTKTCLGPSQECFPLNSCCSRCHQTPSLCPQPPSRMLPLIPPTTRALCRATLSLPPP